MSKKSSKKNKNKVWKKVGRAIYNFFATIYRIFDRIIITPISKLLLLISKPFKNNDRPLDRLLNNKAFLITISLVLAFVVFFIVDKNADSMINSSAEILTNRKVTALYNEEAYVVEGLPETVDITLIGRRADIYLAKQYPTDEVVVDLRDLKPGSHKVSLKYSGADSIASVEYKLDPSTAAIVIYEKLSVSKSLTKEIVNKDKLDSKYTINDITFDRDEVYVKGAEYKLNQVAIVKALVDIEQIVNPNVGTTTLKEIPLVAYDSKGEKLDVEIVPATVDAKIEIASPSKEVPFKVIPEGEVVFGKAINSITLSNTKTKIYGDQESLEKITYIPVKINVAGLSDDAEFNINVSKPSGVREISVPAVVAKVSLSSTSETTINGVNIETRNLENGLVARAASAKDSSISVIVKGTSTNIKAITKDNLTAYVDLQGLGVGTHTVNVSVTGDDVKLSYKPKNTTVTIIISKE